MELDPVTLSLEELIRMQPRALHQLARKAVGSLSRYRVLAGRLLLAIHRSEAYWEHGCNSGIHFAVNHLGLSKKEAVRLVLVARELESLPHLRRLANEGEISWSKLREVVRVATLETEHEWAALCAGRTYAEIEDLVARSQRGEIPVERLVRKRPRSEIRWKLDPDQMALFQRGLQSLCQRECRALSMEEAVEILFAAHLSGQQADVQEESQEALKDLQWTDLINADTETCPENPEVEIVNPKSRVPTPAQRRKLLRRDGYCCAVPGCQNSLWLDIHHIIFYSDGGLTIGDNLITVCTRCHKNIHEGRLRVEGTAPHGLRFLTAAGKDIRRERIMEVAFWLDHWCGWEGPEDGGHYVRARDSLSECLVGPPRSGEPEDVFRSLEDRQLSYCGPGW